uniref:RNA-directed RNA polymerase L n=1 Tax=Hymenopteran rhabdo-related virus OKIAV8 TaxID=2746296 RepID=A0A7D7FLW7_9RHAB|nr:RNA-dependent RNA polymerase [Hymenopteran rhabdo-related virus OKIAV8]
MSIIILSYFFVLFLAVIQITNDRLEYLHQSRRLASIKPGAITHRTFAALQSGRDFSPPWYLVIIEVGFWLYSLLTIATAGFILCKFIVGRLEAAQQILIRILLYLHSLQYRPDYTLIMDEIDLFDSFPEALGESIGQYDSIDDDGQFDVKPSMRFLNSVDYSLNSPLSLDEIQNFYFYTKGKPYLQRWNEQLWKRRREYLRSDIIQHNPDQFHRWFGNLNLVARVSTETIDSILAEVYQESCATYHVVKSFFKGWLGKEIANPKSLDIPYEIRRWGAFFVDLHFSTLLLNASSIEEWHQLKRLLDLSEITTLEAGVTYNSPVFGPIRICLGYLLLEEHGHLLDRNMLLMMKDTYSARFHSLLSMIHRVDTKFSFDDWEKLQQLYRLGDMALQSAGSDAYKGLKLLEPICNLRLCQLAARFRPLIPQYTSFTSHVTKSVIEVSEKTPSVAGIRDLVLREQNVDVVLTYFGSFRHWGHPFVKALIGLRKLHERVTRHIDVDKKYAECLASDLAHKVLADQFHEKTRWMVDKDQVPENHIFKDHIMNNTWPTAKQVKDFGDHWHELPLKKCFEIPDMLDPSTIYSDKSHSMNRDEVLSYVLEGKKGAIPTRKVLSTMINTAATDWKAFLQRVNDLGLTLNELIIGLKEKERELKEEGRFFSLMSWSLREYFVITEYLIKIHFLPLFRGLTMADDLTTLTKKLMENSSGHGLSDYSRVSYSNHLDYEKWNNFQRPESNLPVFTVMGKFLGYPNLIARTHEFFEKSIVYYNQRPDLMVVVDGKLVNKSEEVVCWDGQKGGFEGLRQKGWCVLNALAIERESKDLNTRVTLLAQGDNQIICTNYLLQNSRDEAEVSANLEKIKINNSQIMNAIEVGIKKLGLTINQDETMQSADFLNYGKIPIFRGNLRPLESKRWSRCSCVTNDQLPTLGNVLSTVSSNALTVAHHSASPINTIIHYNFVGNFTRHMLDLHNPALRKRVIIDDKVNGHLAKFSYLVGSLYLDPSLGGVSGTSLTRFLIRGFPDPVTESLVFWRIIAEHGGELLRGLSSYYGDPKLARFSIEAFQKLLENPLSLNLSGSVSPTSKIKDAIRSSLYDKISEIPNLLVKHAIEYSKVNNISMSTFLYDIDPMFPRFLSEFKSATYLGITESLIGLFENSKTIRTVFRRSLGRQIDTLIIDSEWQSLKHLQNIGWVKRRPNIWNCSSTRADELRHQSWGKRVVGATIPHPLELLRWNVVGYEDCSLCFSGSKESSHLVTLLPVGLSDYEFVRGPYMAYLGSNTSESTSLIHPWERETKIPIIKRAARLRNSIHWFVEDKSNLAESIFSVLEGLTGEDWSRGIEGFRRTGSGLHRYSSSRQNAGGFSAQSPIKLTRMVTTTDTLGEINEINYDFMYQSLIIYSQITSGEVQDHDPNPSVLHFHLNCLQCVRPIEEVNLYSPEVYVHPPVYDKLMTWKPEDSPWDMIREQPELLTGNWLILSDVEKCYHIGRAQGYIYGDSVMSRSNLAEMTSMFPLSIAQRLIPEPFMEGLLDGLLRASSLHSLSRRSVMELKRPRASLLGLTIYLIESVSTHSGLINIWRASSFISEFSRYPHRIPCSYPLSNSDLGSMGRYYLKFMFKKWCLHNARYQSKYPDIWIFADINDLRIIGSLALSTDVVSILYYKALGKNAISELRQLKGLLLDVRDELLDVIPPAIKASISKCVKIDREIRHAVKEMGIAPAGLLHQSLDWTREACGYVRVYRVNYVSRASKSKERISVPKYKNPVISGLRAFQCATGSHYKIRSIILGLGLTYSDAICGGDGSGGIGSWVLRNNPSTRLIFNSLLDLKGVNLKGSSPSGPSAIEMIPEIASRCLNLRTAWRNPSDLSVPSTWKYFKRMVKEQVLDLDLITLDMEITSEEVVLSITKNVHEFIGDILNVRGTLIVKTYIEFMYNTKNSWLDLVGTLFEEVRICWTEYTSSQSSEVYIVFNTLSDQNIRLNPDYDQLLIDICDFPPFRSQKLEFERALGVLNIDGFLGVPTRYQLDPFVDLSTLLIILGVDTGISALLAESLTTETLGGSDQSTLVSIYIVSINSILRLTHWFNELPNPPTDNQVRHVSALTMGLLYWFSLRHGSRDLYCWLGQCIANVFPFSWKIAKYQTMYYRMFSMSGAYDSKKNFHYDDQMALVGQIIRVLVRLFPKKGVNDSRKINRFIGKFDNGLTIKDFNISFDVFPSLQKLPQISNMKVSTFNDFHPSTIEDSTYTN